MGSKRSRGPNCVAKFMQSPSELPPSYPDARGPLCLFLFFSLCSSLPPSVLPFFSLSLSCRRRYCIHAAAAGAPDPATAAGANRRHETRFRRRLLGSSISSEPGPHHQRLSALKSTAAAASLRGESQRPHREPGRRRLPENHCDGGGPVVAGAAAAITHPRFDDSLLGYRCVPCVVVCVRVTELASDGALLSADE